MRCFYALVLALVFASVADAFGGGLFARRQVVRVRQVVQVNAGHAVQPVFQVGYQRAAFQAVHYQQRIVVPYQPVLQVQSHYAAPVVFQQQANYCAPAAVVAPAYSVAPTYSVQSFAVRRCH